MERASIDELARAPAGRWIAGETFAHFCATPELWGVILWGRPSKDDAIALGRSLVLELAPPAAPHVSIIDASRLDGADPRAFRAAERYLTHYAAALAGRVLRVALVRPPGLSGAVVSGAFDVLPRPYPVEVFATATDALAWLDQKIDPRELDEIYAHATGAPPIVATLRAHLDAHLADASLATSAKALAVSERSLQRALTDAQTTFTGELADARVRAARRLLADGDAPLSAIAATIGCASLAHFSALYRKRTGETPSAYRARVRRP